MKLKPFRSSALRGANKEAQAELQKMIAGGVFSKYGAKRTEVDGISFASKREAARYSELVLLQKAGAIKNLKLQPRYKLTVNGVLISTYVGDFEFTERRGQGTNTHWVLTCEDVKGYATQVFAIKWRHVQAEYRAEDFRIMR